MDDISDGARRIGITTTEFQKIGNAAQLVGTSVEAVNKAMIRAGVAASKAARDGGDMAAAFARANLDPAKFAAAGLEERIKMVAEAQRAANGDAEKMNKLFEAIGIKAAGIDFAALADEMANVSAASDETVQALARANDELDKAKQSATIFGANLLKGISDAGERLGSLLGGGGGKTIAEMDAEQARQNAIAALKNRGELLPDDSITKTVQKFVGGPVPATVQESVPGPNAQENERRIQAEIKAQEDLNKAKEEQARLSGQIADNEEDQVSKAEAKAKQEADAAKFKQYMLEIDLKIKEAQAAGDKERAGQLERLKEWSEAAVKYEGDLDMAARDVNASLKERLRLKDAELAKQQASIEAELKHTETMAFGSKEAKAKSEWMEEYNKRISKGATDEQAKRFANAATYKEPKASESGGGTGYSTGGSSFSSEPQTVDERIAAMRGSARASAATAAAGRFEAAGQFRSAVRAQDRAQRKKDRAMENARVKDILGGKNMGEAYQDYVKDTRIGRASQQEYEQFIRDQAKTSEERARADEKAKDKDGKKTSRGGESPDDLMQTVTDIRTLLTERLPIRVLAA